MVVDTFWCPSNSSPGFQAVKMDVSFYPVAVALLGANRVVLEAHDLADLVQQLVWDWGQSSRGAVDAATYGPQPSRLGLDSPDSWRTLVKGC
jgi:hypothetical protein